MEAHIEYNPNSQKIHGYFDLILTRDVLKDICLRITGQSNYSVSKITKGYNKGRLVFVFFNGVKYYVSLSVDSADGRNSSLQSVPTAINLFYADRTRNKELCYYLLPHYGNLFTRYHHLYYKMMATAGIKFLNMVDYYNENIIPYVNIDDVINDRAANARECNNSSYISKTKDRIQIYGKVYGANKYESTLFGIVASKISDKPIDLYSISEQDLTALPKSSLKTLGNFDNISIHETSLTLEKQQYFAQTDRNILRSPIYIYNLLHKLGRKRCALCGCEIEEIIQGAHVWPVASISNSDLENDLKFQHATSGDNGLWLCQNHHKLFDANILLIDSNGRVMIKNSMSANNFNYIKDRTNIKVLPREIMTDTFRLYLAHRNENLDLTQSTSLYI